MTHNQLSTTEGAIDDISVKKSEMNCVHGRNIHPGHPSVALHSTYHPTVPSNVTVTHLSVFTGPY